MLETEKASQRLGLARQIVKLALIELMKCINLCTKTEVDENHDLLDLTIARLLGTGQPWFVLPLHIAQRQNLRRSLDKIKDLVELGGYSYFAVVMPGVMGAVPLAICRDGLSKKEIRMLVEEIERSFQLPQAINPQGVSDSSSRPQPGTLLN